MIYKFITRMRWLDRPATEYNSDQTHVILRYLLCYMASIRPRLLFSIGLAESDSAGTDNSHYKLTWSRRVFYGSTNGCAVGMRAKK